MHFGHLLPQRARLRSQSRQSPAATRLVYAGAAIGRRLLSRSRVPARFALFSIKCRVNIRNLNYEKQFLRHIEHERQKKNGVQAVSNLKIHIFKRIFFAIRSVRMAANTRFSIAERAVSVHTMRGECRREIVEAASWSPPTAPPPPSPPPPITTSTTQRTTTTAAHTDECFLELPNYVLEVRLNDIQCRQAFA